MIGWLRGTTVYVHPPCLLLEVQGVGYELFCTPRTLAVAGPAGTPLSLVVETQVRSESITLYGFENAEERQCFRLLQTVPGVGAKVALALLALDTHAELVRHIRSGNTKRLTIADGVGARLASRITAELQDKIVERMVLPGFAPSAQPVPFARKAEGGSVADDVSSALVHLGYRPQEAHRAVQEAVRMLDPEEDRPAGLTFEDVFRVALPLAGNLPA